MSRKAILSHKTEAHYFIFYTKTGGCFSVNLVKFILGREVICNLFPKFRIRHERCSFYGPRKSDEGVDTDLIVCFMDNYYRFVSFLNMRGQNCPILSIAAMISDMHSVKLLNE